jgi:hypothetical protein
MAAVLVSVLIDGALVTSSRPAELAEGVVRAPLDPFVGRIADRITSQGRRITLVRGAKTITFAVGSRLLEVNAAGKPLPFAPFLRRGEPIVPLAAVARALGAEARYDGPARRLLIFTAPPTPLVTMTPYSTWTPPPGPLPTFTPKAVATPRPTVSGLPQPRRTPIVVDPEHPAS